MKLSTRKPINGASRFITIIKPIDGAYDANMVLDAKFTDNTEETRNTFHADGVTLQVTVDGHGIRIAEHYFMLGNRNHRQNRFYSLLYQHDRYRSWHE